jgi:hypothetical protein
LWTTPNQFSTGQILFGTSTDYSATSTGDLAINHSVTLSNLAAGTIYHFAVSSTDSYGTSQSIDNTFTTSATATVAPPEITPPIISEVSVIPTFSIATISWTTDQPASAVVFYGTSSLYSASSTGPSGYVEVPTADHTVSITGLMPDTTYHFDVVSTDVSGMSATSTDRTFTTSVEPN